ncbi:hypothetical protein L7F22_040126 [Adiantum nelumboides]|nr:hypothetical protein [Adiantum nelumboides]
MASLQFLSLRSHRPPRRIIANLIVLCNSSVSFHLDRFYMGTDQQEVACTTNSNGCIYRMLFDDKQCQVAAAKALLSIYLIESKELEIGECVGQGSSGEVHKGFYKGQDVAVKVVKGTMTTSHNIEFRSKSDSDFPSDEGEGEVFRTSIEGQFRREVLSLISCPHKNILKIYGVCLFPQLGICIVTKFMRGGTLLHYLQQRTTGFRLSEILKLAKDVAKGMEYLHSRGIIHMYVIPHCVM